MMLYIPMRKKFNLDGADDFAISDIISVRKNKFLKDILSHHIWIWLSSGLDGIKTYRNTPKVFVQGRMISES